MAMYNFRNDSKSYFSEKDQLLAAAKALLPRDGETVSDEVVNHYRELYKKVKGDKIDDDGGDGGTDSIGDGDIDGSPDSSMEMLPDEDEEYEEGPDDDFEM